MTGMPRESQHERRFREAVRRDLGGLAYKFAPVHRGNPDQLVLLPGGVVAFVELKTVDGQLSPAQRLWHRKAADLGTTVSVLAGTAEVDDWVLRNKT